VDAVVAMDTLLMALYSKSGERSKCQQSHNALAGGACPIRIKWIKNAYMLRNVGI